MKYRIVEVTDARGKKKFIVHSREYKFFCFENWIRQPVPYVYTKETIDAQARRGMLFTMAYDTYEFDSYEQALSGIEADIINKIPNRYKVHDIDEKIDFIDDKTGRG